MSLDKRWDSLVSVVIRLETLHTYYSTVLRPPLYLTRFYTPLMNSAVLLRTEILCYRFLSFRKIIFRPNRALVINHKWILFFGDSTFVHNVRRYNSIDYKQFLGVRGSTFFYLSIVGGWGWSYPHRNVLCNVRRTTLRRPIYP